METNLNIWPAPRQWHIEMAKIEDAAACAALQSQAFFHPWDTETFESFFSQKGYVSLVACDAMRSIVGVVVSRQAADETEIITMIVDKNKRHLGLGKALMGALRDYLARLGPQKLFLEVHQDNESAVNLYKNQGFKQVGVRNNYYPQPDQPPACALVMRYDLV